MLLVSNYRGFLLKKLNILEDFSSGLGTPCDTNMGKNLEHYINLHLRGPKKGIDSHDFDIDAGLKSGMNRACSTLLVLKK